MDEKHRKRKHSEVDSSKSSDDESDILASKTSAQILNELFGKFSAFDEELSKSKKSKKDKKKKKDKHKHKHKEKDKDRDKSRSKDKDHKAKHKKKDRKSNSSSSSRRVSIAEDQSLGIKVEVSKERTIEIKEKSIENEKKSPIEKEQSVTPELEKTPDHLPFDETSNGNFDKYSPSKTSDDGKSPELPSIAAKNKEEEAETTEVFEKQEPKPAASSDTGVIVGPAKGKIQIKSLKTSAVFEQTIREIEEEARIRAEKFEEGELTPSSSSSHAGDGSTSPSFSDVDMPPPQSSPPMASLALDMDTTAKNENVKEEKKSKRHHSNKNDDKDSKKKDRSRSRSRDRKSRDSKRHDGRDRHRSRSHERDRRRDSHRSRDSRSHRSDRHRSRSRDRDSRDKRSSRRGSSRDRDRFRRGSESYSSKSREYGEDGERIDKRKLLAIARRNAMYLLREQQERMIQAGVIPGDSKVPALPVSKPGGKTVAELTEYCKQLVKSKSMSGSSDDDSDVSLSDGEGPTESFIHHPFALRDRPNAIVMNIRNSTQLPTRSMQEKAAESSKMRSLQFPVSSGQQHRSNEWVPVSPKKTESETSTTATSTSTTAAAKPPAPVATDANQIVDIGSIISQKLSAMRKMQETAATSSVQPGPGYGYGFGQTPPLGWESGQFTGTTGAKVLTPAELASGQQAWARKDQLKTAAPVAGGMGMKLLQKMGWRPGEGLGKNKEGSLEPLKLDVKMDKKGLVAQEEVRQRFQPFQGVSKKKGGGGGGSGGGNSAGLMPGAGPAPVPVGGGEIFSGKHPVSALVELCTKRHWGAPSFEVVFESGPDHKKNFVFKVTVNNRDYQPNIACGNKKQAKAMAAQHCLEQLGLIVKMAP